MEERLDELQTLGGDEKSRGQRTNRWIKTLHTRKYSATVVLECQRKSSALAPLTQEQDRPSTSNISNVRTDEHCTMSAIIDSETQSASGDISFSAKTASVDVPITRRAPTYPALVKLEDNE